MPLDLPRLARWVRRTRESRPSLGEVAAGVRGRIAGARVPIPPAPQWVVDARESLALRMERAACRVRLWWLAWTAPMVAWIAAAAGSAADRFEEARDRLSYRLRPLLRRWAERWEDRARRAG